MSFYKVVVLLFKSEHGNTGLGCPFFCIKKNIVIFLIKLEFCQKGCAMLPDLIPVFEASLVVEDEGLKNSVGFVFYFLSLKELIDMFLVPIEYY